MKKTTNKVTLIGCGAVGSSFLYSAINRGIAEEYVLIDAFPNAAEGNAMDLEDANSFMDNPFVSVKKGSYNDLKDTDVLVITAGRPQKDGETRLEMVSDNARIMKSISEEVVKSGFKGITVIASNPVDIMTYVYAKITGFDKNRVISSGTSLDSSRLQYHIANKIGVSPKNVQAYVLGEHGDSSVMSMEHAKVGGLPLQQFKEKHDFWSEKALVDIQTTISKKAYEIISRKRATFYGIGAALADITKAILRNEMRVMAVSPYLNGEYGHKDVYAGTPCIIGANGIEKILEFELSDKERKDLDKSISVLKDFTVKAFESIK